jgi:SAM-dependent methyltransferase
MNLIPDASLAPSLAQVRPVTECKVCGQKAPLHGVADFNKSCEVINGVHFPQAGVPVSYHRCIACGFLFTEQFDHWTPEMFRRHIYNESYAEVDPECTGARAQRESVPLIAFARQVNAKTVLDYGGGDGSLARILNENGIDAHSWDPLHPGTVAPAPGIFDLVTAFEVLEHTPTPIQTCRQALSFVREGGLFLFSTLTLDDVTGPVCDNWYVAPRNGHISIHTSKSLQLLFARLDWRLLHYGPGHHMAFAARQPEGDVKSLINSVPRATRSRYPG